MAVKKPIDEGKTYYEGHPDLPKREGFDIIYQMTVGRIEYDELGIESAFSAALHEIVRHADRAVSFRDEGEQARYHFVCEGRLITLEIEVGST